MKKIILYITVLIILFQPLAYGKELAGHLVYLSGTDINILNLENKQIENLVTFPGHFALQSSTTLMGNYLVFSDSGVIKKISLSSKEIYSIADGNDPIYITETDALLYYVVTTRGNLVESYRFVQKNMGAVDVKPKEIMFYQAKPFKNDIDREIPSPSVDMKDGSVLFIGPNVSLWRYNTFSGELKDLDIKDCVPKIFIKENQEVLCETFSDDEKYKYLSLETKSRRKAKLPQHSWPLAYSSENKTIFFGEIGFRWNFMFTNSSPEKNSINYFDIQNKKKKKLLDDTHSSSAVWVK